MSDAERELSRLAAVTGAFPFPQLLTQPFIRREAVLSSRIEGTRAIWAVAFTPDGSRFVTASSDGTAKIWDTTSGEELLTLLGHTGRVYGLAISSDGTKLTTTGEDGISRIYLLNIDDLVALARSRLTRSLTPEECQKYLHVEVCPAEP